MARRPKKQSKPGEKVPYPQPTHPWRLCPAGEHYRKGTIVRPHVREGKPVRGGPRSGTCAQNPSGKDQLYPEEMRAIADSHFYKFEGQTLGSLKEFKKVSARFDASILGWTQYWNEVLLPNEPLDPILVKALIATESGFDPEAWNKRRGKGRARGLMQVTDASVEWLSDQYSELRDHYLNLSADDMLDPNLAICAGIRWLFRKKELAEKRKKTAISWRDAVAAYKSVRPDNKRIMGKLDQYFTELKGAP